MGEVVRLEAVKRSTGAPTRVVVYAALRAAIVGGELEPGRKLSENELATELGVSRTPIREALGRLRDDRLVEVVPQLGTFVSKISNLAVADAQFIRAALECAAVRRAAEVATEEELARLEANLQGQERAAGAGEAETFNLLDKEFHRALCELSGHPTVWAISERAKAHLNRVRRLSLKAPSYMGEMLEEHRAVLAAVAEHDPDRAEAALRHHLEMVLSELPRFRVKHPDYFED